MGKYAFTNGHVLNGHIDMEVQDGLTVYVDDKKIVSISNDKIILSGYEVIDLQGQYLMPGMTNLHVHLPGSGKPKSSSSSKIKEIIDKVMSLPKPIRNLIGKALTSNGAKTSLMSGVTTLRCVGGVADFDSQARDRIASGKELGARLLVANQAIAPLDGHMAGTVSVECKTIDEAITTLRKIAETKPDLIKLMITGGVLDAVKMGEPGVLKMSEEMVKACCDEAHKLGFKVAAHVESTEGVLVALRGGVDTIEHGAAVTDEIIELYKRNHAAFVSTISPALPFALFDRSISKASEMAQFNGKIVFLSSIESAVSCLANDIPVGLGTDVGCPYVTHYDFWRELVYFVKYVKVSNRFALHTATLVNAQIAGIGDITGSIDVGKEADLIVTKDNPLQDLTTLRNVTMVMGRGNLIRNPKVKRLEDVDKELDKFL